MVIFNIGQLLTAVDGIGLLEHAWLKIEAGKIRSYGLMCDAPEISDSDFDARGKVVMPGFVDCHTHLAHAGGMQRTFADRCRLAEEISEAELRGCGA